jgi:hypothetical protein
LRQQGAPRGVGKRGKGAVESGVLILNHVVKCRICAMRLSTASFQLEFSRASLRGR